VRIEISFVNHLRKVDLTMDDVYPFEADRITVFISVRECPSKLRKSWRRRSNRSITTNTPPIHKVQKIFVEPLGIVVGIMPWNYVSSSGQG